MSHRLYTDCQCYNNCPEKDSAGCRYRQAENQVKELLLERKVLRDPVAARLNTKEAEQTPTNNQRVAALVEISRWCVDKNLNTLSVADVVELMDRLNAAGIEDLKR